MADTAEHIWGKDKYMKQAEPDSREKKKAAISTNQIAALVFLIVFIAFLFVGIILYRQERENIIDNFQRTSMMIRDSIIDQIHYDSFSSIVTEEDMEQEMYQNLQSKLNSIRVATSCRYLYTAQALPDGTYIYVVDGLPEETEDFAVPGTPIEPELFEYMERSLAGESMLSDSFMNTDWGKVCTAYFPIYDDPDEVYGVLCMEFDMEEEASFLAQFRTTFLIISLLASFVITLIISIYYRSLRMAKEAAQKAKEEVLIRLETILNGVTGGLIICKDDAECSYEHISDAAAGIQGYTPAELSVAAGNRAIQNIYPEDRDRAARELNEQYSHGDKYSLKYRVVHKDGSIKWLVENGKKVVSENGEVLLYCFCQDVTKAEEQNKLLRQERKQYRDALIHNCEFFYSFDVTEGLLKEDFRNSTGGSITENLGLSIPVSYDRLHEKWIEVRSPRFLSDSSRRFLTQKGILEQYQKGERTFEYEYYLAERDIYVRVVGYMTQSEDDGHVLAVIIGNNITGMRREEERAKRALEDAYERANRANAAKSDFLASMSHDIRTPMNAIIGMTAIAGMHLDDRDRVADCLGKITVASKHLLGIINEVLDMSKIESGRLDLSDEEFSLPELVDNLLIMSRQQIEEKRHTLTVDIRSIQHERVIGDSQRIQQTFMNLMSNAIKYTPEGGQIRFEIIERPSSQPRLGCYDFIFEDNGIGMSEEFQKHLFEPFSRDENAQQNQIQGTGLGLAISQNIVKMMNGNISVESELGKGSRFTMTLCLKLQETEEELSYEELVNLPVLVVDDDQISCETTCEILDELGMQSDWVLTGREAVERVVKRYHLPEAYFAVIIDWKMPEMDGIATTREIRRQVGREVPIIIISAYDWSDIELEARAAGANAFIRKPMFKSRMAHLFRELLGAAAERDSALTEVEETHYTGKRVLLVEDNELNAEIAQEILEMQGITVERAKDGKEALDMMAEIPDKYFNLIFMDIRMPVLNGYEAARAIRALPREYTRQVPIVAMTANAFEEDIREAYNSGMNGHIAKPLDMNCLSKMLDKWLNMD